MRKIASLTAIALGVLVFLWPMFTMDGGSQMAGFPAWFLAGGLVVIGAYNFMADYLSRAAGFGTVLILFSLMAFAISLNMLPIRRDEGLVRMGPMWDFDRFGVAFASVLAVAGVAYLFVRDGHSAATPRMH